jgi:cytochrome c biogenesis protein CcdA
MLASITPLGERGRRSRWGITVTAFLLGATLAGAAEGAVLGLLGSALLGDGVGTHARLLVLAGGLLIAVALELLLPAVPGPNRQVNERWLDEFRGWVYGFGFGAQLGLGITTVVTSTATYAAMFVAFLSADPAWGALVLGVFGAIRGVTPMLAAGVRRPEQLRAFHRRFERLRGAVAPVSLVVLVGMTAAAVAGSLA